MLVDGFAAPIGDSDGYHDLYSGKKHLSGQNVQVVADLDGQVADVGDPVPGARTTPPRSGFPASPPAGMSTTSPAGWA